MSDTNLERILAVVRRELGADDARVDMGSPEPSTDEADDGRTLRRTLPDGRQLVVRFAEAPADRTARAAQLDLLIDSFAATLHSSRPSAPPPPGRVLCEELIALCERAHATAAAVIDAHSPIVWASSLSDQPGHVPDAADPSLAADAARFLARRLNLPAIDLDATSPEPDVAALLPPALCRELGLIALCREGDTIVVAAADPGAEGALARIERVLGARVSPRIAAPAAIERAIDQVFGPEPGTDIARRLDRAVTWARAQPELPDLHRGASLRAHIRGDDDSALARSFATIYVLVLTFDQAYDEIAAERALSHALPIIERLVTALPPMDPSPSTAGVVALRGPRRRR